MNIDHHVRHIGDMTHPVYKGERYFFAYSNNRQDECLDSGMGGLGVGPSMYEPVSVYFTAEELKAFRPGDSQHAYCYKETHEVAEEEVQRLQNYKKSQYCYKYEKERIDQKIFFLQNNYFALFKVNFV